MSKSTPLVEKTAGRNHSQIFVSMALDMSWRLALVVLVPIIGGYYLDQQFSTTPLLTIVGFLLAMGGMSLVMWRTLQEANKLPVPKLTKAQKARLAKLNEEDE